MNSRDRRVQVTAVRWLLYVLVLLCAAALQAMPGLLAIGAFKPYFLLGVCLAVALCEGEFYGALFGVAGGLLWDYLAGRVVGLIAILMLFLCFLASVLVQLYLKRSALNFFLLNLAAGLLLVSIDYLFFYVMPGYTGAAQRYCTVILPEILASALLALPIFWLVGCIDRRWRIQD